MSELKRDTRETVEEVKMVAWAHHLQQMVIAPDPIQYLGEHI